MTGNPVVGPPLVALLGGEGLSLLSPRRRIVPGVLHSVGVGNVRIS